MLYLLLSVFLAVACTVAVHRGSASPSETFTCMRYDALQLHTKEQEAWKWTFQWAQAEDTFSTPMRKLDLLHLLSLWLFIRHPQSYDQSNSLLTVFMYSGGGEIIEIVTSSCADSSWNYFISCWCKDVEYGEGAFCTWYVGSFIILLVPFLSFSVSSGVVEV